MDSKMAVDKEEEYDRVISRYRTDDDDLNKPQYVFFQSNLNKRDCGCVSRGGIGINRI